MAAICTLLSGGLDDFEHQMLMFPQSRYSDMELILNCLK